MRVNVIVATYHISQTMIIDDIMLYYVILCYVMWCDVMSYHIVLYYTLS